MPDIAIPGGGGDKGPDGPFPQDFGAAVIRTATPYITAWVVTKLAQNGFNLDADQVNAAVVTLGGSAWYVVIRALEQRWPKAGWLLGSPKQPTYNKGD